MHTVLDLDLDFFVDPVATCPQWEGRAPAHIYKADSIEEVRAFLEQRCHLRAGGDVLGAEVVKHDEAFWVWKRWVAEGKLAIPFRVVHVDAHADVGIGDFGWKYLLTELLALPVVQRSNPLHGSNATMNEGNYLAFAVGNQWLKEVLYVYSTGMRALRAEGAAIDSPENRNSKPADLRPGHFRGSDPLTRLFELKHCAKDDSEPLGSRKSTPIHTEPAIPFDWVSGHRFEFNGFTHMIVAQSPQYTPDSADVLLPVIGGYYIPS